MTNTIIGKIDVYEDGIYWIGFEQRINLGSNVEFALYLSSSSNLEHPANVYQGSMSRVGAGIKSCNSFGKIYKMNKGSYNLFCYHTGTGAIEFDGSSKDWWVNIRIK